MSERQENDGRKHGKQRMISDHEKSAQRLKVIGFVLLFIGAGLKIANIILCSAFRHIRQYAENGRLHFTSDGYFHSQVMEATLDVAAIVLAILGLVFLLVGHVRLKKLKIVRASTAESSEKPTGNLPEDIADQEPSMTRRALARGGLVAGVGALLAILGFRSRREATVWQIDPHKCIQCGACATACVLTPSAVKCVHAYALCGYCDRCFGFFDQRTTEFSTAAENQLCPAGAIVKTLIDDPYYQYTIDEPLCVGCAKCVKGCGTFGNGSLFLQIRHDRCANCNQCAIARACPSGAIRRVPADAPYLLKDKEAKA